MKSSAAKIIGYAVGNLLILFGVLTVFWGMGGEQTSWPILLIGALMVGLGGGLFAYGTGLAQKPRPTTPTARL